MSESPNNVERVLELAESIFDDNASENELVELDDILLADPESRDRYLEYCRLQVALRLELRSDRAVNKMHQLIEVESAASVSIDSHIMCGDAPSVLPASIPIQGYFHNAFHGAVGFFSQEQALSMLIAAVIMISALCLAWTFKITHYRQVAEHTYPVTAENLNPDIVYVGRITGMKDCNWADPKTEAFLGSSVPFNRRYALASGLLEITYKSGAKVILEGPCTYQVESRAGGYLVVGKLTAKVESGEWRVESARPQEANLQISKSPNLQIPSSFILHPSSLFTVRTPTAIVTDLGTEFGVEVGRGGETLSHVFRGSVTVTPVGGRAASGVVVLGENESARVLGGGSDDIVTVSRELPAGPPRFVRVFPRLRKTYIDLADVVAGGDGFGRAKQRGIDAASGSVVLNQPGEPYAPQGDGRYHPVEELPFVDGVFVPDGGQGAVQITSAGHRTSLFVDSDNNSWNLIWSGRIVPVYSPEKSVSCWLGDVNYAGRGHSVLSLPANKGITFDLDAIRRANPDVRIVRFTAVAGNAETRSENPLADRASADLWVFVDGRPRFSKTDVNSRDGPFAVDVTLADADRFLTLAATDAGNETFFDWTIFGDPRLLLSMVGRGDEGQSEGESLMPDSENKRGKTPMKQ